MTRNQPKLDNKYERKPASNEGENTAEFGQAFLMRPPMVKIVPPEWPPRPDIFDEVLLRKPITPERAHDAYMAWHLPDETLGQVWRYWEANKQRPYPRPPDNDLDIHVLAHNVYEHLMSDPLIPVAYAEGNQRFKEQGLDRHYDFSKSMLQTKQAAIDSGSLGYLEFLDLPQLQAECQEKGLDTSGTAADLQSRVIKYTMDKWSGMLLKSDLSHWGVERPEKYTLEPWNRPKANALEMYTAAIQISPYNPTYWVSRAYCHYQLGYFDLAIGDAYRAQLLCDVLEQSSERNRRPGFYARIWEAIEAHLMVSPRDENGSLKPEVTRMRKANGITVFVPTLQKSLHTIISLSLAGLNSWDDYHDHMKILRTRLGMPERDVRIPQLRHMLADKAANVYQDQTQYKKKLFFHEHSAGAAPANRPYPLENQDLDRTSSSFLDKLNQNVFDNASTTGKDSSACRAAKSGGTQEIGVFAKSAIKPYAIIHVEEPTIRGHLPPRRLAKDLHGKAQDQIRCENCLKKISPAMARQQTKMTVNICPCSEKWLRQPNTPGLTFCKPAARSKNPEKSCLEIARELHHFSSCGKDWQWLYDAMRPVTNMWMEKEYISHTNEGHGTMLMLLLRNVFEIALHRRAEEPEDEMRLNAHEIDELLVLDGNSESWRDSFFPFNMAANIKVPFDILEALGVDIFQRPEFDTWVIQIILRKLLVNAVPWDPRRQGNVPDRLRTDRDKKLWSPEGQHQRMKDKAPLNDLDPSLANMYLFPGLSMFNHSCEGSNNADWGYDTVVPNRVIVWATKDIAEGEEIRIRYRNHAVKSETRAIRFFGGPCRCPQCLDNPPRPATPDVDDFTDQTFSEPESDPRTRDVNYAPNHDTEGDGENAAHRECAVVENGKVVIYRDLRRSPSPFGKRKRDDSDKTWKGNERGEDSADTPWVSWNYTDRFVDTNGKQVKIPRHPQKRAEFAREHKDKKLKKGVEKAETPAKKKAAAKRKK